MHTDQKKEFPYLQKNIFQVGKGDPVPASSNLCSSASICGLNPLTEIRNPKFQILNPSSFLSGVDIKQSTHNQ